MDNMEGFMKPFKKARHARNKAANAYVTRVGRRIAKKALHRPARTTDVDLPTRIVRKW